MRNYTDDEIRGMLIERKRAERKKAENKEMALCLLAWIGLFGGLYAFTIIAYALGCR